MPDHHAVEGASKSVGFLASTKEILFSPTVIGATVTGGYAFLHRLFSVKGLHKRIDKIESSRESEALETKQFREQLAEDMGEMKGMLKILTNGRG